MALPNTPESDARWAAFNEQERLLAEPRLALQRARWAAEADEMRRMDVAETRGAIKFIVGLAKFAFGLAFLYALYRLALFANG